MGQINTQAELRKAIADLEAKKSLLEVDLKDQFQLAKFAIKPVNLLSNIFSKVAEIPEVRKALVSTIVGFGMGYLSKKAHTFISEQSVDNLVGNMVNSQVTKIENKNPESFFSKALSYVRTNIKKESPLYPFLAYKNL